MVTVPPARMAAMGSMRQQLGIAARSSPYPASRGADRCGLFLRHQAAALAALFSGTVGKDVISRKWREVKADWEALCRRDLQGEASSD
jgi:hypothetical protein